MSKQNLTLKQIEEIRTLIENARKAATMERMSVGSIYASQHADGMPIAVNEKTLDNLIRERTKIYRESWIIGPLDLALEVLEGQS